MVFCDRVLPTRKREDVRTMKNLQNLFGGLVTSLLLSIDCVRAAEFFAATMNGGETSDDAVLTGNERCLPTLPTSWA